MNEKIPTKIFVRKKLAFRGQKLGELPSFLASFFLGTKKKARYVSKKLALSNPNVKHRIRVR
jgi:hypothetical protein